MKKLHVSACLVLALGAAACVNTPDSVLGKARPIAAAGVTFRPSEAAYQSGVNAINDRDYDKALQQLQLAKLADPSDSRVLNALGVLYDKLGRFDVSRRYYLEALEIDPRSEAVAHNLAYSAELTRLASLSPAPALSAEIMPAQPVELAQAAPVVAPTAAAVITAPAKTPAKSSKPVAAALTGDATTPPQPTRERLTILDATGSTAGASVRQALIARKWVAAPRNFRAAPVERKSTIHYDPRQEKLALALASTLPRQPLMVADYKIVGVQLTVGQDARNWQFAVPKGQYAALN
jgi:tetratricopeptide (TPR) repeat protein